jgi:hypothetical protein
MKHLKKYENWVVSDLKTTIGGFFKSSNKYYQACILKV